MRIACSILLLGAFASACSDPPGSTTTDAGGQDAASPPPPPPDAGDPDAGFAMPDEVCPRPSAPPVFADVNGDGIADIADPIALQNYLFRGGLEPTCEAATDFNRDGLIEADDATRIISYEVAGSQPSRTLSRGACNLDIRWPDGPCAPLGFFIGAPARVTSSRFTAQIAVQNPMLADIQGWAMSVTASGCELLRAGTDRTSSAEVWDEPPGLRHLGYSATTTVAGGAISFVDLSYVEDIYLPRGEAPFAVLTLELGATVPDSGCAPCTISLGGDLTWLGQPISTAIAAGGYSYVPNPASTSIDVCKN